MRKKTPGVALGDPTSDAQQIGDPATGADSARTITPAAAEVIAAFPGDRVAHPRILWVGAGAFFRRVIKEGAFGILHQEGATLTVLDVRPEKEVMESFPFQSGVQYFNVKDNDQRKQLIHEHTGRPEQLFTHCYIANWPQAHLLSAVKYSSLCAGGDIIITKPLDLNIPLVETLALGVFPDISEKILMDDHYRNK